MMGASLYNYHMRKILWSLFYIFVFSLLLHNSFSYLDPDYGWHFRFGEIIWQTKDVPHDQIFMWTLAGKSWVDHEWLGNLALYGIEKIGGYIGVSLFFALLIILTYIAINWHVFTFYLKNRTQQYIFAVFEIGTLVWMRPHLGVRLQEITVVCFALLLIILDRWRIKKNNVILLWLPPLLYIWACSHAGFLIGLAMIVFYFGYELVNFSFPSIKKYTKDNSALGKNSPLFLTIISIVSFGATMLTPYGVHLYSFLSEYHDSFYRSHLEEWLPPYSFPIHYGQIGIIILAIVTTIGTFFFLKKINLLKNSLIVCALAIFAMRSVRHFPLLSVGWLILIIPHCVDILSNFFDSLLRPRAKTYIAAITAVCLLSLSIVFTLGTKFTTTPYSSYCNSYPCAGIDFLRQHPEISRDKLLNHYNFGGFVIGTWPELRLFIDGRLPQYPFAGTTTLREYSSFSNKDLIPKKLAEYDIKTVFYLKPPSTPHFNWFEYWVLGYRANQFTDTKSPLIEYLAQTTEWQKVFEDRMSIIYVKQ